MIRQALTLHGFKCDEGGSNWSNEQVQALLDEHSIELNANELAEQLGELGNPRPRTAEEDA